MCITFNDEPISATLADLHHQQHEGQHQSGDGHVAEDLTQPSREVGLQRLLDHIKHTSFPTEDENIVVTPSRTSQRGNDARHDHLKGPQSKEGGMVTMV